uniref:Uncharacterized protein n=1 Tax=Arundo donax TaxID=35708 RepID=A0A0A9FI63_ARUDO
MHSKKFYSTKTVPPHNLKHASSSEFYQITFSNVF